MSYIGRHRRSTNRSRWALASLTAGAATVAGLTGPTTAVASAQQVDPWATSSGAAATITQMSGITQSVARPAEGTLTSGFGPGWGTMHNGIDIANAIGTPIHAVMAGTVISSGPASGYGQWIRVQHDDGAISIYGHMSALYVSVGERVGAGQVIAGMGNEGFSTGSHLHFEIHPSGSGAVDPQGWFADHGIYF